MALPATDTFSSGSTQGLATYNGSWTVTGGAIEVTAAGIARGASGADHMAAWNADTFGADHYSQATISVTGVGDWAGVAVRAATGAFTGYELQLFDRSGGNVSYSLDRVNAGAFTNLATGTIAWTNGDTLRLEVSGTGATVSLVMKKNSVQFGSTVSDTSGSRITTAGRAGIAAFDGTNSVATLDNWQADNLTAGSPGTATPDVGLVTLQGRIAVASAMVFPGVGAAALQGKTPGTSAFQSVRIRQVLVSESGQAAGNLSNISLLVWYAGRPAGAPDVSVNGMTSDANGSTSWSIPTGTLGYQQPIFFVACGPEASLSAYTCGRIVPNYE